MKAAQTRTERSLHEEVFEQYMKVRRILMWNFLFTLLPVLAFLGLTQWIQSKLLNDCLYWYLAGSFLFLAVVKIRERILLRKMRMLDTIAESEDFDW